MPRINPVNRDAADAATGRLLDSVQKKLGIVPNLIATMANSPAVANAYLGFSQALSTRDAAGPPAGAARPGRRRNQRLRVLRRRAHGAGQRRRAFRGRDVRRPTRRRRGRQGACGTRIRTHDRHRPRERVGRRCPRRPPGRVHRRRDRRDRGPRGPEHLHELLQPRRRNRSGLPRRPGTGLGVTAALFARPAGAAGRSAPLEPARLKNKAASNTYYCMPVRRPLKVVDLTPEWSGRPRRADMRTMCKLTAGFFSPSARAIFCVPGIAIARTKLHMCFVAKFEMRSRRWGCNVQPAFGFFS